MPKGRKVAEFQSFRARAAIVRRLRALGDDRASGASQLAARAVRIIAAARPSAAATAAAYHRDIRRLIGDIAASRPGMAPIGNAARRVWFEVDPGPQADAAELYREIRGACRRIEQLLANGAVACAEQFARVFSGVHRWATISYSSQVIAALERARVTHVTVCEARPRCEGRRTARRLAGSVRSLTLVTEAQIAGALETCDAGVIGCDGLLADGSVQNKVGSRVLALVCRDADKPFVVVGDRFKLSSGRLPTEDQPPGEVWSRPAKGVVVRNTYFERVPPELISHIVLEDGVHRPQSVADLIRTEPWLDA